jgi:ParB-like chromosome segregation protein Spo0J
MDEFGATSRQAAQLFGIPEGTIRGTVRLLKLPEESKQKLQNGQISQSQARRILRKPETDLKRLEPKDDPFNLREKLTILVYDRVRSDVSDELLFKKIREIAEQKKQLERQVEMMNSRKRESAKTISTGRKMAGTALPSR